MTRNRGSKPTPEMKALREIGEVLDSIPSAKERSRIRKDLTGLQKTVQRALDVLDGLPKPQRIAAANRKLEALQQAAKPAQSATSVENSQNGLVKKANLSSSLSQDEIDQAEGHVAKLKEIPSDSLNAYLEDGTRYSVRQLRAIASKYGLPPSAKYNRRALVNHITRKIINLRGYQNLLQGARQE